MPAPIHWTRTRNRRRLTQNRVLTKWYGISSESMHCAVLFDFFH